MFYLKECLRIFKDNFLLTITLGVSTLALVSVSHHHAKIKDDLSLNKKSVSLPYFNALITNKSKVDGIIRRMKKLPGVSGIQVGSSKNIKQEIASLQKTFGQNMIKGLTSIHYQKLKIELEKGLQAKSSNLIREYLTRLVGKDSITLGEVRQPKELKLKNNDPLLIFLKSIDIYAYFLFGGMWILSAWLIFKSVNTSSFLIEKFQRRKNTNIKIFISGFSLILIPVIAGNISLSPKFEPMTALTVIVMAILLTLMTLKSRKDSKK